MKRKKPANGGNSHPPGKKRPYQGPHQGYHGHQYRQETYGDPYGGYYGPPPPHHYSGPAPWPTHYGGPPADPYAGQEPAQGHQGIQWQPSQPRKKKAAPNRRYLKPQQDSRFQLGQQPPQQSQPRPPPPPSKENEEQSQVGCYIVSSLLVHIKNV
jgi:hypothetical protein